MLFYVLCWPRVSSPAVVKQSLADSSLRMTEIILIYDFKIAV